MTTMSGQMLYWSRTFNAEFPERYPWASLDSILASNIGTQISTAIDNDLKTQDRLYVAGLRNALLILAESVQER